MTVDEIENFLKDHKVSHDIDLLVQVGDKLEPVLDATFATSSNKDDPGRVVLRLKN